MLMLMGVTYVVLGVGHLLRENPAQSGALHAWMPDWANATIWGVTGLIAIVFAWRRNDGIGWAALYVSPMFRIVSYLGSWVVWFLPGGPEGSSTGWYGAAVYLPLVFAALICSGWREVPPPTAPAAPLDDLDRAMPPPHPGEG